MEFTKLVISGGGIKGISFIGAIKALEEKKYLENINTYVGVSVGSIISLCINLNFNSDEMLAKLKDINLNFHNDISVLSLFQCYGLNNCNTLIDVIKSLFISKNISPDITFRDLFLKTKKELIIVVTNLSKYRTEYLSYKTKPDLKVISAIRMSINIPIYFHSVIQDNDYYIDGALTDNFPINPLYPNGNPMFTGDKKDILVLKATSSEEMSYGKRHEHSEHCDIKSFEDYFSNTMFLMIMVQDMMRIHSHNTIKKLCENEKINHYNETIFYLNTKNYHSIQFDLNETQIKELYDIGYNSIK